jgi:hypothetical protein
MKNILDTNAFPHPLFLICDWRGAEDEYPYSHQINAASAAGAIGAFV